MIRSLKVVLLLCVFSGTTINANSPFDAHLLTLRYDYLNNKGTYLKYLDNSFWTVFNKVNSSLSSISVSFNTHLKNFNPAIEKFPFNKTKSTTASRLKTFHTTINSIGEHISDTAARGINSFHYGTLGEQTEPLLLAEMIWGAVENNLDGIPALNDQNEACVKAHVTSYHKCYLKYIELITQKGNDISKNISNFFSKDTSNAASMYYTMNTMSTELNKCAKSSDVTACVKTFVSIFKPLNSIN